MDKHNAESIKLYSKTNQFKFSQNDYDFNAEAKSVYFELFKNDPELDSDLLKLAELSETKKDTFKMLITTLRSM